ncbi:hypothetical protein MHI24_00175 [Paenibacillus sp. FSL K6-1096]|uniref:hypothetical protein n=1 Tax=Paenibacillus sp. FSL K6-1096 TaxID=2921460 RepID=UPI0030EE9D41
MKIAMILGILLLSAAIIIIEFRDTKSKKARRAAAGITLMTAGLTILLFIHPGLPGPTELVKLLFGKIDLIMK